MLNKFINWRSIGLCLVFGLALGLPSRSQAQVFWTDVENISRTESSSTWPSIATDVWGGVHVVWTQKQGGSRPAPPRKPLEIGDAIYYSSWDGRTWSKPVDIVLGNMLSPTLVHPAIQTSLDGQIYLIWSDIKLGLYFSRATVATASNTQAWTPAEKPILEVAAVDRSRLWVDAKGVIHIVYSRLYSGEGGDGNVSYIRSTDNGETWTSPRIISLVNSDLPVASLRPSVAIDAQGGIHVVWDEARPPRWTGDRVLYSHSTDGGDTWTLPVQLASFEEVDERWASAPSIAITSDGQLHVVWTCGYNPERCYRFSANNGQSWSSRAHIFPNMQSLAGWDAMLADAEGKVHFIAQLRQPEGIYYASLKAGSEWSPLVQVVDKTPYAQGHFPAAAISQGNQLNVVMQNESLGEIWYFRVQTGAKKQSPAAYTPVALPAIATAQAFSTAIAEQTATAAAQPTRTPLMVTADPISLNDWRVAQGNILLLALLPLAAVLIWVVLRRAGRQ